MEENSEEQVIKELKPRCYQLELLKIASESNTILYLPTGTGKTYIAVMLIKQMAADICNRDYDEGGKRSVYLANSVCLVQQQAQFLAEQLPYSIGCYTGDKNVDMWTGMKWNQEFKKHNVLVATPQIILNILLHGYITMDKFNLLIFDECHQAVGNHPMRLIMAEYMKLSNNFPRILGLSATLLNRNISVQSIRMELLVLEQTYDSKVVTTETLDAVLEYDVKPEEELIHCGHNNTSSNTEDIVGMIDRVIYIIEQIAVSSPSVENLNEKLLFRSQEVGKKIINVLKDLLENLSFLGYYGMSWGILAVIIGFEKNKRNTKIATEIKLYQYVINRLEKIRAVMIEYMGDITYEKIRQLSSQKVNTLLDVLQKYKKDDFASLIFVKRRSTAKILYFVLRNVVLLCPLLEFVKCNFVTGLNTYLDMETLKGIYQKKNNDDILLQFKEKKLNVLICTSVLEEGIDVQSCSLVIMFDIPNNYRAYVQSKGRARFKNSKYLILYYTTELKMVSMYQNFKDIDDEVQLLINNKYLKNMSLEDESDDSNFTYVVKSTEAVCTMVSATTLLYRYCASLPQDRFTQLEPLWYWEDSSKKAIVLELPTVSPVRNKIIGPRLKGIKRCKQGVALEAIKLLHQHGELNDFLIPLNRKKISMEDMGYLFSHWDRDGITSSPKKGSHNQKRSYTTQCPEVWKKCNPAMNKEKLYLHTIKTECKPEFESNTSKLFFNNIYSSSKTYAILSSKKIYPICDFPIFPNGCEVVVSIEMNQELTEAVTDEEIKILERFHAFIFVWVLKLIKSYTIFDLGNDDFSFLIVPVDLVDGKYKIDIDTASKYYEMEPVVEPNILQKRNIVVRDEDYIGAIVFPWYRNLDTEYLVCRVDHNLNALSPFPSEMFENFASYFKEKWNISIENQSAPLVLVQPISKSMNMLKQRKPTKRDSAHRNQMENFEEHFIPELCVRMSFPGLWWLKAKCLPSILHRIHLLLNAEEFRREIVRGTGLGQLNPTTKWQPLPILKELKENMPDYNLDQPVATQDIVLGRVSPPGMEFDLKDLQLQKKYQWKKHNEPLDIERDIEKVTLLDIEFYDRFVSQDVSTLVQHRSEKQSKTFKRDAQFAIEYPAKNASNISILNRSSEKGPELWNVLQALSSNGSNDVINLERLEILGDSFLKFSTSLFLTLNYPLWDEGRLTTVKGEVVGNRNLYYCAKKFNIGNIMNTIEFDPNAEWCPPRFSMPRFVATLLQDFNLPISSLYLFEISKNEQMCGVLAKETVNNIFQKMVELAETAGLENDEYFNRSLQQHLISDKTMADCIEALIGCYLLSNGLNGAFKIIGYLNVLPSNEDYTRLMLKPSPSPFLSIVNSEVSTSEIDYFIPNWQYLEEKLGYHFKNRGYLLQALTHPSYIYNRLTPCYQRLEFVGDAVIDFLITCYIYENCGNLDPGDVTDLRSALVNNVVFATLTVRNDFHKFILMLNPILSQAVEKFVQHQIKHDHVVNDEVLLFSQENEVQLAEYVNVPKTLGDVFESLMGAVFFDSGMNLQVVWGVAYKLMISEIHQFSAFIPRNPIRLLFETHGANPRYEKVTVEKSCDYVMIRLSFTVDGTKQLVYGCGDNTKDAKRAAAKIALQTILLSQSIDNKDMNI